MTNSSNIDELETCPICFGITRKYRKVVRAGKVGVCCQCGSWYRMSRPNPEGLAKIYNEDYYNSWGILTNKISVRSTKTATFTPVLRRLENITHLPPNKRLLDVGAATGILLEVAKEQGWAPYASEINPYSCKVLREKFGCNNVFEGQLTECDFPVGHFSAITMTDVIEHVLDVKGTLKAAANLLCAGGILCVTTPRIDSISHLLMRSQWFHFKEEHIQYFSRRAINKILEEAGFGEIKVSMHAKNLTFNYLHNQLREFPNRIFTPLISACHRILPESICNCNIKLYGGEMLVFARKS